MTGRARVRPDAVRRIGLVGVGLIGAGWAAYFQARGLEVTAHDPSPDAPAELARTVAAAWPMMRRAGLVDIDGAPPNVAFADLDELCARCDVIIESGPELSAFKRALIAQIDALAPPEVVIASSSSSLLPSEYQQDATNPGRILGAHPFNPPSLVPLVEVTGGERTDPEVVDWTLDFFRAVGKRPIRVRREQPGFVANRMSAALFREAVDLVASGVASVEDVDAAICNGPGLRWAAMGPHLLYHLGGGAGGYRAYLDHLGPSQEARWASLRTTPLTSDVREQLIRGVFDELATLALSDPEESRDIIIAEILALTSVQTSGARR